MAPHTRGCVEQGANATTRASKRSESDGHPGTDLLESAAEEGSLTPWSLRFGGRGDPNILILRLRSYLQIYL